MHLGYALTSNLDDKAEILHKRNSVRKLTVSCVIFTSTRASLLKLKLMGCYCSVFFMVVRYGIFRTRRLKKSV